MNVCLQVLAQTKAVQHVKSMYHSCHLVSEQLCLCVSLKHEGHRNLRSCQNFLPYLNKGHEHEQTICLVEAVILPARHEPLWSKHLWFLVQVVRALGNE